MRRRIVLGSALVIASGLSTGCMTLGPISTALPTTGVTTEGAWSAERFPFPEADVQQAALDGMADLQMHTIHQSRPGHELALILDATTHDGRHCRVTIRPATQPGASVVATRIGRFGDEALSLALLERVGIRLGTLPAQPIPEEPPTGPSLLGRYFSSDAVPDEVMLRNEINAGYRDTPVP